MPRLLPRRPIETPPSCLDEDEGLNGLVRNGCDSERERRAFIRRQNGNRRRDEERAGHHTYCGLARQREAEAKARACGAWSMTG